MAWNLEQMFHRDYNKRLIKTIMIRFNEVAGKLFNIEMDLLLFLIPIFSLAILPIECGLKLYN